MKRDHSQGKGISWRDKNSSVIVPVLLFLSDYLVIVGTELISYSLRKFVIPLKESFFDIPNFYFYFIIPIVFLAFLHFGNTYMRHSPFWKLSEDIFKAVFYATVTIIMIMYFGGAAGGVSRIFMALQFVLGFTGILLARYFLQKTLSRLKLFQIPVIFIGAGKTAELVVDSFSKDAGFFYQIKGFIDDRPISKKLTENFPILGTLAETEQIIQKTGVQHIVITAPGMRKEKLIHLLNRIQPHVKEIVFAPDLFGVPVENLEIESFFNEKVLLLKMRNNLALLYNRMLKKSFDFIVGMGIFILILPILLLIACMIKQDSVGPVFHTGKRIGKNGKEFACYKFRSMYMDADRLLEDYLGQYPEKQVEWETFAKLKGYDPRVTKVGRWLRRFSLDELPQILNVVIGNMSLVGPRPYLPREKAMIGDHIHTITLTAPGITGFWQVSGRNEIAFAQRVLMDVWYVKNWSIWMDIVYLFKTVSVVLNKKGAY